MRASTHLFNEVLLAPIDLVSQACKPFFQMGSFVFKCMGFLGSFWGFCRSWLHSWVGPLRKFGFSYFGLRQVIVLTFLMYDLEWMSFSLKCDLLGCSCAFSNMIILFLEIYYKFTCM